MPSDSTSKPLRRKTLSPPKKPYDGFPLTPHSGGKWQKKIRHTTFYFGRWFQIEKGKQVRLPEDGWQEALAEYDSQKADLHAGRTPGRTKANELTVGGLCNAFLRSKLRKLNAGELSRRMFQDYQQITDLLVAQLGAKRLIDDLVPDDFGQLREEIASRCGVVRRKNEIIRVRSVFKYGLKNRLLEREVVYGDEFGVPSNNVLARHREESDRKLFEAAEIRLMLDATLGNEVTIKTGKGVTKVKRHADPQLRAAVLLGLNCGAGNSDLSNLQREHLDLEGRWLDCPRSKTGSPRRIPLWEESCNALRLALAARPPAKDKADDGCVFLTDSGTRLVRVGETSRTDYVGREFTKLLRALKINSRRGLGLYSLRHTFASIALQTGDRDCVRSLLGHVERDVLGKYYDELGPSDERRIASVNHVRGWLFGDAAAKVDK